MSKEFGFVLPNFGGREPRPAITAELSAGIGAAHRSNRALGGEVEGTDSLAAPRARAPLVAVAVRHGLTAETVIGTLEDADDYKAFELAITSGYDARWVLERELVLRLASLLWRLRRATTIETVLFEIAEAADSPTERASDAAPLFPQLRFMTQNECPRHRAMLSACARAPNGAFPLLTRYEHTSWRQARQLVLTLESLRRRQYARPRQFRPAIADAETPEEDL